jgi:hypothetical protein
MKDGCTAASAPSARAELSSAWEEATTEHSKKRSLAERQRLVMTQHRTRHQEVHEAAETRPNERFFSWILFDDDDYRDGWRTGGLFILSTT